MPQHPRGMIQHALRLGRHLRVIQITHQPMGVRQVHAVLVEHNAAIHSDMIAREAHGVQRGGGSLPTFARGCVAQRYQSARVSGNGVEPSAWGLTSKVWYRCRSPVRKAYAEPAMYNRQMR